MSSANRPDVSVIELPIRVFINEPKTYHAMMFNESLGVDFEQLTHAYMERENNIAEFNGAKKEQPKFGAGSEFGREAKEKAYRSKVGIVEKKYRPEDQPWILETYGDTVKKFKGTKLGGISDNASYFIFSQAEDDGYIKAVPVKEFYKFRSIQRYKTLSAEEAEIEFNRRENTLNYFSLMSTKRLKGEKDTEKDEEVEKSKITSKKDKELKISEMDEWMDSTDADSESEKDEFDDKEKNKKKKKGKNVAKPKKKDPYAEAYEDSDDGDEEGRELDYVSDSSESEPEDTNLDGVAEEKGLKKLLNSDEEDSEESETEENDKINEENDNITEAKEKEDDKVDKKDKKCTNGLDDNLTSDSVPHKESKEKKIDKNHKVEKKEKDKQYGKPKQKNAISGRLTTRTVDNKRKLINDDLAGPSKKAKLDLSILTTGLAKSSLREGAVRKHSFDRHDGQPKLEIAQNNKLTNPITDNKRKAINVDLAGRTKKRNLDLPILTLDLGESDVTDDVVPKYPPKKPTPTKVEMIGKKSGKAKPESVNSSGSSRLTDDNKRKVEFLPDFPASVESGITEDAVRKSLMKISMTTKVENKEGNKQGNKSNLESTRNSGPIIPTIENKRKLVFIPNLPGSSEPGQVSTKDAMRKYPTKKSMTTKLENEEKSKQNGKAKAESAKGSRLPTPKVDNKHKPINDVSAGSSNKPKLDLPIFVPGFSESIITEDAVRKHLMREPMTTTELLQKFKSSKAKLSSQQLVNIMSGILKKINPITHTFEGKIYLSVDPW